jgi:hypothetical protein
MNDRMKIAMLIMPEFGNDRQVSPEMHARRALELADALIDQDKADQKAKKKPKLPTVPETTVMVVPTNKFETEGENFRVTGGMVEQWRITYPGVDVLAEILVAKTWCCDNKTKRKTIGGMQRFLGSWLKRAQDKGGSRAASGSSTRGRDLKDDLTDTSWAK